MKIGERHYPYRILSALILGMILLAACLAPAPQPIELPQTGDIASVSIQDQTFDGASVVADQVVSHGPGWLAIHAQTAGNLGPVIGYSHVNDGVNKNVAVEIDPASMTKVMYAILHVDAGKVGVFEFPGVDGPELENGKIVSGEFKVSLKDAIFASGAAIAAADSSAATAKPLKTSNPAATPTAPAVQTATAQPMTTAMASLPKSTSEITPFPTVQNQAQAASPMNASEMTSATPVISNTIPSITIEDQYLRSGTVMTVSVYSQVEGFLTIHNQNSAGTFGPIIGWTPVNPGENRNVVVKIDLSRTTKTLYAMLHVDEPPVGILEYPGPDYPVIFQGKMVMQQFIVTSGIESFNNGIYVDSGDPLHLVDKQGISMYTSLGDTIGVDNCNLDCQKNWLPVLATGQIIPGPGVQISKIGIIILKNGSRQITYAGLPLYYFLEDKKPGDMLGEGMDGLWFLATP